jgi:hypothetical protein
MTLSYVMQHGPRLVWRSFSIFLPVIGGCCFSATTVATEETDQTLLDEFHAARANFNQETQTTSQVVRGAEQLPQNPWASDSAKALLQAARKLAERSAQQERLLTQVVEIPAGASAQFEEFVVETAELHNERARIENELRHAPAEAACQALLEWESRERSRLERWRERAVQIAAETARQPIPLPAAPNLTPADNPVLREFLAGQHALAFESAREENRILTLPPAERDEARRGWQAQRNARMTALAEQALAITSKDLNVKDDQIDRGIHESAGIQ